jgi:hypothetical protein
MCDECPSRIFNRNRGKIKMSGGSCKYSHRKTEHIKIGLRHPCTRESWQRRFSSVCKTNFPTHRPSQDASNPLLSLTSHETHPISGLQGTSPTVKIVGY